MLVKLLCNFTDDSDYSDDGVQTFIFSSSNNSFTFNLYLIDDNVYELTEILSAILTFSSGIGPPRASFATESANITICDDDCKDFTRFYTA